MEGVVLLVLLTLCFFVCGEWTSGAYLNCVIKEISCSALLSAADLEQSSGICGSKER